MGRLLVGVGLLLGGAGVLAILAGRRLAERLRGDPYHREGDAAAAYLPGCGALLVGAGILALLASQVL